MDDTRELVPATPGIARLELALLLCGEFQGDVPPFSGLNGLRSALAGHVPRSGTVLGRLIADLYWAGREASTRWAQNLRTYPRTQVM